VAHRRVEAALTAACASGPAQVDSIYLSCISLATVGYGDIHPKSEGGYAFTTVWLLCGTVVIAKAIGSSLTYVMDRQRYQYMMDTFDPGDMNSGRMLHLDSVRAFAVFRFLPPSHWRPGLCLLFAELREGALGICDALGEGWDAFSAGQDRF
jgi:hypothetical protein